MVDYTHLELFFEWNVINRGVELTKGITI